MATSDRFQRFERCVFFTLVALQLGAIWSVTYLPTLDGPVHLANVTALLGYLGGTEDIYAAFYALNPRPTPNWFAHGILGALASVVPMLVAEKVFVSLYVAGLPLAARFALRAVNSRATFLSVLAFPFVYNDLFHKGFYGFCLSTVAFLLIVGYWIRHSGRFTVRTVTILAVLVTLSYCLHPVSFVVAGLVLGGSAALAGLVELAALVRERSVGLRTVADVLVRQVAPLAFAFLPAFALLLAFLTATGGSAYRLHSASELLMRSVDLSIPSLCTLEVLPARAVLVVLVVVTLAIAVGRIRARRLNAGDGWPILGAALFLLYLKTPDGIAGGGFLQPRLLLFPPLLLLIWFAHQAFRDSQRIALQITAVVIAAVQLSVVTASYVRYNQYLEDYMSVASYVRPESTILAVRVAREYYLGGETGQLSIDPFFHAAAHVARVTGGIYLGNHAARSEHFPLRFTERGLQEDILLAADRHLCLDSDDDPWARIGPSFPERAAPRVDYIVVHGAGDEAFASCDDLQSFQAAVTRDYDLLFVSPKYGLTRLYGRRPA